MSFDGMDKIKIINPPRDLTNAMPETAGDKVRDKSTPERFKVHIHGQPWKPLNLKSVKSSSMLLRLVQTLEQTKKDILCLTVNVILEYGKTRRKMKSHFTRNVVTILQKCNFVD